jgi:hypothetical protein
MFNISWPTVQITSNRPFHSTASCAQQIFNMPSQGNLNVNYTCDNFRKLFPGVGGSGGAFFPAPGHQEILKASENPFEDAAVLLASVEQGQQSLVDEVLGLVTLTGNETALLKYYYYYRNSDFANARLYLSQFTPSDEDETDYKALCLLDLSIIENGWEALTEAEISSISLIRDKGSVNSNYAISILNNSANYRDYLFNAEELPGVMASPEIKHIEYADNYLVIRPNPATDRVFIEYLAGSLADTRIQLFDASGKLVTGYTVNNISGGIEIDIRNLNEGFYFVTLTDKGTGRVKSGKLIKTGHNR